MSNNIILPKANSVFIGNDEKIIYTSNAEAKLKYYSKWVLNKSHTYVSNIISSVILTDKRIIVSLKLEARWGFQFMGGPALGHIFYFFNEEEYKGFSSAHPNYNHLPLNTFSSVVIQKINIVNSEIWLETNSLINSKSVIVISDLELVDHIKEQMKKSMLV